MCLGCYEEAGKPKIYNDKVKEAVNLIKEVYEHSCVGGNLHVQIDDYNLSDDFFKDEEMEVYDENAPAEQIAIERQLYALLRIMTEQERVSAVALYDGFWHFEN
jgi:hypothetical protein